MRGEAIKIFAKKATPGETHRDLNSDFPVNMNPDVASDETDGQWTNEKHLHFLNSMEASFVRTMLENSGRFLRLDRYLPDSSESTLDLKSHGQKRHIASDIVGPRSRRNGRTDRRSRRLSAAHRYDRSQQDQVVPQLENGTGFKDENDLPNCAC